MSATISLKQSMARGSDAVLKFLQYSLMIAGFLLILGILGVFTQGTASVEILKSAWSQIATPDESQEVATETEPEASVLSPGMQGALDYVTRRYRVSPEALEPVFEVAQLIGKERRIDPLLIVAIIGIESGFDADDRHDKQRIDATFFSDELRHFEDRFQRLRGDPITTCHIVERTLHARR